MRMRRLILLPALFVLLDSSSTVFAQNWSFDARRIALGGVGTAENIASQTALEERGYRAVVLPFGLLQVLPDWNVFDPSGDDFNPVCAMEYAASPLHFTIGRKRCDPSEPGPAFVSDIVNARLSRDLNTYRGFRPDSSIVAEGLANPSWGKTFAVRRNAGGGLVHGVYVGAGPYFSIVSKSQIDPALIDLLASTSPVPIASSRFSIGSVTDTQMALALTGGYRGRIALANARNESDGLYVAANYHYLHGFRFNRFDLMTRFDTDAAGLITIAPATLPVSVDRLNSESGRGFALDLGAALALGAWTFGFGANGIANRIDWDEVEHKRYVLQSLIAGGDFVEVNLAALGETQRVELPVNYTANVAYSSDTWSAESEFTQGFQGTNVRGGLERRIGTVDLRGGARYSRNRWHPSGGVGINLTPRFGIDVAAFSTSANIERRRDTAIAVSLRFTHENF
jgi:hypothetical protein